MLSIFQKKKSVVVTVFCLLYGFGSSDVLVRLASLLLHEEKTEHVRGTTGWEQLTKPARTQPSLDGVAEPERTPLG